MFTVYPGKLQHPPGRLGPAAVASELQRTNDTVLNLTERTMQSGLVGAT